MKDDRIRLYMGTTNSGKTYLFCQHLTAENRTFVFDTMADEKLAHYGVLCGSVTDVIELSTKKTTSNNFHIRMQFDAPAQFAFVCKVAMELGECTIAVDELSLFCSSQWMPEELRKVIRLGRHRKVRFMATTQRPADIQSLILSQTKEAYIFQMHLPNDVDYLGKFIPGLERAQNLKQGEYILWTPSTKTVSPPTPNPETLPANVSNLPENPLPKPPNDTTT
jgi:hypothetical protein